MKNIITLAVAAALSLSLASAFASQSEGGFSIGVKGGYNNMDLPTSEGTVGDFTLTGKKDKMVGDLHMAYLWPVADVFQLGAQLGYSYYGKYTLTETAPETGSTDNKITAFNLQLLGQWNIQQWFVQGRVGAGYFHQSNAGNSADDSTDSSNKIAPIAGLSGGYFFTDNFSAEVFVDHVFGKNYSSMSDFSSSSTNKPPVMTSAGLGVTYSF